MRTILTLLLALAAATAFAQTYQMVPSGDPQNPYRIEAIAPPPTFNVSTFDAAIKALRSSEGIDPTLSVRIMQNPGPTASPAELCSSPQGTIVQCANSGLGVQ